MIFYGLDKDHIMLAGEKEGGYYRYWLGSPVEVTSFKKKNVNGVISGALAQDVEEDRMMVRYCPVNSVHFSCGFIESRDASGFASLGISDGKVLVGHPGDYKIGAGVLAMSGVLSLNGAVMSDRKVMCSAQSKVYVRDKVRVLACGARDGRMLALYYLPNERGIALACDEGGMCLSAKTLMLSDCRDWSAYTIGDWFDGARVKEVDVCH